MTSPGLAESGAAIADSGPSAAIETAAQPGYKHVSRHYLLCSGHTAGIEEPVKIPLAELPVAERDRDIRIKLYAHDGVQSKRRAREFGRICTADPMLGSRGWATFDRSQLISRRWRDSRDFREHSFECFSAGSSGAFLQILQFGAGGEPLAHSVGDPE